MDQQHDGSSGGSRSGGDPDAWRVLLVGLLEKVDVLAAGLLGGDFGPGERRAAGDGRGAPSDFSAQIRTTLEVIIEEAGELIWQMLGQLIAILEAIQQALEQVMGSTPGAATTAPTADGGWRERSYEPITVHFDPPDPPPTGGG